MKIRVVKRQLNNDEIDILIEEVKKFYSPVFVYKDKWKRFHAIYIATINNVFAGLCGIEKINKWIMLHPFVVLKKYQRKGVGSSIMKQLVHDNSTYNIFIGSQNPVVAQIVTKLGYKTIENFSSLPLTVKVYLLKYALENFNSDFIRALYIKRNMSRGKFRYFIRMNL